MKSEIFNDERYYTVKEVYMNLCVTRNSIIKKLDKLKNSGYVLEIKKKRPSIYINEKGYNELKKQRIAYLNEQINKNSNNALEKHYLELKAAIGKPELWEEHHHYEIRNDLYFNNGELIVIESKRNNNKEKFNK